MSIDEKLSMWETLHRRHDGVRVNNHCPWCSLYVWGLYW